ncbi:bifunctional tRNA (5-methylaminomethyl-2-thiouridine)(34)-methyltransferase MnmD/FAD-dependent 5-carboxymethylaminomethyl-2-thiouridine(34) oxidoreductase MnmC [Cellvibrio sp. OA-2007]|uniref:bifunctional tRNA (5-methylaminomethyl-2-thiouridine)(34)-methyltransferase MnmD/FAD-dependent 5-carboxymethylaminomethyl-2-thiouridine(34) oxidoreductase MnmC n=1 Tax=Cellvibrio sp. OA-2007 TaxID=529823 RepID=UPI00078044C4|nr:bifunctional tRNA (5-methylaminomethyl-2-thiouridine)(34)-methyltransferase MnmD/FAD-dependent 5-carboxymethylaminomethyl-2-thiouridine(34) oxidoreductase MnmC [Cellvibrio sp. OA-2007]
MSDSASIGHAQLQWDEDGQPVSSVFGDVYFSRANGLEETRHVFLQHNQLSERWQQLTAGEHFTIAETGFGSGLNFLAAWQLWLNTAPASAQLHFVSVEKFPLTKPDLQRALALWPELDEFIAQLLAAYPTFVDTGFHRLSFMDGRIRLTLIINDAATGFAQLLATPHPAFASQCAKIDAWFLDGFAPSKNPQMWSDALFTAIRQLSHTGTTAATFSAAAIVKQGLTLAGFTIQKVPGFGRKREMVKACMEQAPAINYQDSRQPRSYSPYPVPWTINTNTVAEKKHALIIGGGLAGCTSARALAERGWEITLVERHATLAQEASGNPQGVLYAKLSPKNEAQAEFNLHALQFAQQFYRSRWNDIGERCGVLQLAHCESEQQLHQQLHEKFSAADELVQFVDAAQATAIAGITLTQSALYFPDAGWINPRKLCETLTDHPAIKIITDCAALVLEQRDDNWQINNNPELRAPVVIIANASDAKAFALTQHLPIKSIRGQITYLPPTDASRLLKTIVCSEGYIGPAANNQHCTGATFNLKDETRELRAEDHRTNLENLRSPLPELLNEWRDLALENLPGRVAFRCTLPDYLPLIGAVPDEHAMLENFAPLRKNARAAIHKTGRYHSGLFINIGHGSRGLAYTPLCAELLAAQINQETLPLPRELANALNPARFLIRDLIKNKR